MTPTAQCAVHADRAATSVCPRCGAFTCAECNPGGQRQCPGCQQLTGLPGGAPTPTPWERRGELGLAQALWQTWRMTVLEPAKFWGQLDPHGPPMDAFLYGWLITSAASLLQVPFLILNLAQTQAQLKELTSAMKELPGPAKAGLELFLQNPFAVAVGLGVVGVVLFPVTAMISAGLTHLGVRMVGGTERPFGTTLRAICYSLAPNVLQGIPVVGGLVGLYTLVLEVWGIRDSHRLTTGRAIVAVLWPLALFCCCGGLGGALVAASVLSKLGR
ncbi:MAG: YIP1 family protein [Myxococcus sp.]|nr:YIP1 family protein [Myxococcus sp.]